LITEVPAREPRLGLALDRLASELGGGAVVAGPAASVDYRMDESLKAVPVVPAAVVLPSETAQVAAAIRIAAEHGVPVVARGAGTGLSGGATPLPGGIVISFERMAALLEIDEAAHVAVVQPGLTLAELDLATSARGLVYPVFPGTNAASLGGNIATNAGGMRAVKYGVTRHHVLGLEAVTGTGQVLRSGGRFVKNATGYDLAQLIVGSEGTLALVTEATLRLQPRLRHTACLLAPYGTVTEVAHVIPRVVSCGVAPMILEYIDRATMKGLLRQSGMDLGISDDVVARTEAYLVVVLEAGTPERLDGELAVAAQVLGDGGAHDVFVLPGSRGADLLAARENAFWMVKAAGADDLIDMVVPRNRIPEYLQQVEEIADGMRSRVYGCGHAGDGNIHFSVYEPDPDRLSALLTAIYSAGVALGGSISGEHGIGRSKKRYLQVLEDPGKLALYRSIKHAFDPAGVLNPGCLFDPGSGESAGQPGRAAR
jgi:glycolate oxidase